MNSGRREETLRSGFVLQESQQEQEETPDEMGLPPSRRHPLTLGFL